MTPSDRGIATRLTPTDDQVMELVAAGDMEAFGQLYDRFGRRAFGLARAVCRDPQHAEDAVQEAFLSIWRSRATYRAQRGGAAAWLLTIVRHRAIDIARSHRAAAAHRAEVDTLDAVSGTLDLAEQTGARDEFARLRSSLGQLSEVQREVISLAFFGQLTHAEIAAQLDLPPGTVKSRIRLGLEHLQRENTDRDPRRTA